jgi:hypothetical protein
MNPITIIKFIGAWFFIVAAIVLLVLTHTLFSVEGAALLSVAFSLAPATW